MLSTLVARVLSRLSFDAWPSVREHRSTHGGLPLMIIDMGDKQITVNCIAPGGIKTDMYHAVCREYIPGGDKLNDDEVDEV